MLIRSYMSGSMQLLSTPGTYSSRSTLLSSTKDCRIKQKIGTPDTGLRRISLWSPKHEQKLLSCKPNRVHSWTGTSVMLSFIYTTTVFTFLLKAIKYLILCHNFNGFCKYQKCCWQCENTAKSMDKKNYWEMCYWKSRPHTGCICGRYIWLPDRRRQYR